MDQKKDTLKQHSLLNRFHQYQILFNGLLFYAWKDMNDTRSWIPFLYLLFVILLFILTMSSILWLLKEGEKIIEKNKVLQKLEKKKN